MVAAVTTSPVTITTVTMEGSEDVVREVTAEVTVADEEVEEEEEAEEVTMIAAEGGRNHTTEYTQCNLNLISCYAITAYLCCCVYRTEEV